MTEGAYHVDRVVFFPRIRASVFRGFMTQGQVDGVNELLDAFELAYAAGAPKWLAYMLATVFHETAAQMLPIKEYGQGRGRAYGKPTGKYGQTYYGRGYVQLTWMRNYAAMSPVVGVDLVANPDEALKPSIAFKVMSYGMEHGVFTGEKLADFINAEGCDFLHARRIVNGMDCAALIAGYASNFLKALEN